MSTVEVEPSESNSGWVVRFCGFTYSSHASREGATGMGRWLAERLSARYVERTETGSEVTTDRYTTTW